MNIVIIGGDAAGMSAASRIKRAKPDINVVVFEKTKDVSYSACGMPYNIADPSREIDDLIVRPAEVFREKQGIDLRLNHEVTKIDPNKKVVYGVNNNGEFEHPYDKLLIATGARPIRLDIPGNNLPGVFVLKNLQDGREIKRYIEERCVKKAVIIGMGYIALEMCEALVNRGILVQMIKPNPRFLPNFSEEIADKIKQEVLKQGIELYFGNINEIRLYNNRLQVISDDTKLDADMVLMATGVKPNSELAKDIHLETSIKDSIAVDKTFNTSNKDIYAAGDCADTYNVITGKKTYVPLALLANRGGIIAADNMLGKKKSFDGIVGTAVFKVFDLQVAKTGLNVKEAEKYGFEPVAVTIKSSSRAHGHPGAKEILIHMVGDKRSGRLLGAQMVGEEGVAHRINSIAVGLHAKITVKEYFQCDLAYAPPFSPVWDPTLMAARQLLKKM